MAKGANTLKLETDETVYLILLGTTLVALGAAGTLGYKWVESKIDIYRAKLYPNKPKVVDCKFVD